MKRLTGKYAREARRIVARASGVPTSAVQFLRHNEDGAKSQYKETLAHARRHTNRRLWAITIDGVTNEYFSWGCTDLEFCNNQREYFYCDASRRKPFDPKRFRR